MTTATAAQLYYSSCKHGLSGYSGFQTCAASPGVDIDERREIETKALYQPPRNLPREPDADLIAAQFPVAFKTIILNSGRTALLHTVYTGQDYSGRWGNYLTHALILDEPLDNQWPIDAYTWSGWIRNLAYDNTEPQPLPRISLTHLFVGTEFSYAELSAFLAEEPGREQLLATMLRATILHTTNSRSVVIHTHLELEGAYWLACIQKAFPPTYQADLSCSTFQFDPKGAAAINVTLGTTDFLFDDEEYERQFYVFDLTTGKHSVVAPELTAYTDTLAHWLATNSPHLEGLHRFARIFDYHQLGPGLLHILKLYQLKTLINQNPPLVNKDLYAILEFVTAKTLPAKFTEVLEIIGKVTKYLDPTAVPQDWQHVIRFLIQSALSTGLAEQRRTTYLAWIDAFDHFIIRHQLDEAVILSLHAEISAKLGDITRDMAQAFLGDAHFGWVKKSVERLPRKSLAIVMKTVDWACHQLGRNPAYQANEIHACIDAALSTTIANLQDANWILAPYATEANALAHIIDYIVNILDTKKHEQTLTSVDWEQAHQALGQALVSIFNSNKNKPTLRIDLLNQLKTQAKFIQIILVEWEHCINDAPDKIIAHAQYERDILPDTYVDITDIRSHTATALLKRLTPDQQQRQASSWLESGACRKFSLVLASTVLTLVSQQITLVPEDSNAEKLATLTAQELDRRELTLNPDRIKLRAVALRALQELDGLQGLRTVLDTIDKITYTEFIELILPRLLTTADSPQRHCDIITATLVNTHQVIFRNAYERFLGYRRQQHFTKIDLATIVFWLYFNKDDFARWPILQQLQTPTLNAIATHITTMKRSLRTAIEHDLDLIAWTGKLEEEQYQRLDGFLQQIKNPQPISWLEYLFKRNKI